jgi:hypothetical protein
VAAILAASLAIAPGCSRKASPREQATWNAEIAALQAEQDSLRSRGAELVAKDARIQALPKGDVVLGIPTAFVRGTIERVFVDVASNVTLSLSGLKVHVEKTVKKVVTIGKFTVDVDLTNITGKLKPGKPEMSFGTNELSLILPVDVTEGVGFATIHFVWDGKNVAGIACGDMDITQKVSGTVIPGSYVVPGRMKLAIDSSKVICTPAFPETKLRLRIKPSKASWAAIDSILGPRSGACGYVIDKVNVPNLLSELLEVKGVNVGLPFHKLKPFVLPGGVSDSVTVGDKVLLISTRVNSIRIDPDAIWYGASVAVKAE